MVKWRKEHKSIVEILDVANEILKVGAELVEQRIVHLGINPQSIFVKSMDLKTEGDFQVVLSGWTHASAAHGDTALVDNLVFTSILKQPPQEEKKEQEPFINEEVDRPMIANSIYFLLYER